MPREGKHSITGILFLIDASAWYGNCPSYVAFPPTQDKLAGLIDIRNDAREKLLLAIDNFTTQAAEKLGDGSRLKLLKVFFL